MTLDVVLERRSKLIIPQLAPLYSAVSGLSWLGLRAFTGALLLPHGAQKLFGVFGGGGLGGTAKFFESVGYGAPDTLALTVGLVEFVGGLCLILGFFTRPAAVAIAIFMAFAIQFHAANGFFWAAKGYEYPVLWGMAAFFFAVHGGGAYSLDRKLGREF